MASLLLSRPDRLLPEPLRARRRLRPGPAVDGGRPGDVLDPEPDGRDEDPLVGRGPAGVLTREDGPERNDGGLVEDSRVPRPGERARRMEGLVARGRR